MDEVTRGGWADKLRAMPTGPMPDPAPWRGGDLVSAVPLSPIDSLMRMMTKGQVGILTPQQRDALRGLVRDYVPDGAVNAFERGVDAAGHLSAALPYGTFVRAGQAPVAARNAPVVIPESVLARNAIERQAAMQAHLDAIEAAKRAANPESAVQIVPRQPAAAPPPPPMRPATGLEPPIPFRQQPPPSMSGQGSPGGFATGADSPQGLPGSPSLAPVPPPPTPYGFPPAGRLDMKTALDDLEGRLRYHTTFRVPAGPNLEKFRQHADEVAQKYGIEPGRLMEEFQASGRTPYQRGPAPITLPEPPPLNAFEAAGGKAQMRLPFPTTNDMRMQFWNDLQSVLNHGGKLADVDRAAAANASGLSPRMVGDRLKRAGKTGVDGQELADLIRRGIESGNWKLAIPAMFAGGGMIGDEP